MYYVILAVIEAKTVPCRMFVPVTGIEILVGITGQVTETFHLVLYRMAVHYVHYHGYAVAVSLVDEGLKLFGCSKAARRCEKAADMIAERTVIRVFLYRHYLNAVVSVGDNPRQYVVLKFSVRAYLLSVLRHAYMALVYQ